MTPVHVADSDPYPWPFDGGLRPGRLALVVAGAQWWWVERTVAATEALASVEVVADVVRGAGGFVVHVRHGSLRAPGRANRLPVPPVGAPSWHVCTDPQPADVVVDAAGVDGFYGSPLDAVLRRAGRDLVVLAGLGLEGPLHSTLRSANDRGYECLVVPDACAPHDPALVERALSSIRLSCGIFGATGPAAALCDALRPVPALSVLQEAR